jgi:hypothetical protein
MRRLVYCGGLLILGLAFVVPSFAGDQKKDVKKKDDPPPVKKDEPTEKLNWKNLAWADGKLTQLDPNSLRDFTLKVTVKVRNPDAERHLNDLQRRLARQQGDFNRTRDPNQKANIARDIQRTQLEIAKAQQDVLKGKEQHKDVQLRAVENVKVRMVYPPPDYDDKGNLKKYTAKELEALKGKEGLPGYTAEFDSLRKGQQVRVWLARKAGAAPIKGGTTKGKKIEELDDIGTGRPEVAMIMILQEPTGK